VASDVRLFEHQDFSTLLALASRDLGVPEPWCEKDYYLTETLRVIAATRPRQAFLKGGTSLSKGWSLLSRISEDIDLVLNVTAYDRKLRGADVDRELFEIASAIAGHGALRWDEGRSQTTGGKARHDFFDYRSALDVRTLGLATTVIVEAGVRSGLWPVHSVPVQSMIGLVAQRRGQADVADDVGPFEMLMLHFTRTFVEKLMAIHSLVLRYQRDGVALARNARHYADLYVLGGKPEAVAILGTPEFEKIRLEQDAIGKSFPMSYVEAPSSYRESPALFPNPALRADLERQYIADVTPLFYGDMPSFSDVLGVFESFRDRL
jgi:hypothetical protein